jgi:phosphonate transport system permease protein
MNPSPTPAARDLQGLPDAPQRLARRLLPAGCALAVVGIAFWGLKGDWVGLFSADSMRKMADLLAGFFPPTLDAAFLGKVGWATAETLAMSFLGTLLAFLAALLLAVPAAGFWGRQWRSLSRLVLNALRAVPELVWAAMVVIAAGLGPFTGTLALALHTAGVLGRLIAEALENTPSEPYLALRRSGASATAAFCYGTWPGVLPQVISYTLYRWENNIRAAAVLGVVGAGGLGQLLYFHLGLFHFRDAGTVLLAMLLLVGLVDAASAYLRQRLA